MATAQPRREHYTWIVNNLFSVYVHNDSPVMTGASMVLECFNTDKEGVELKMDMRSKITYIQFPVPSYRLTGSADILKESLRILMAKFVKQYNNKIAVSIDNIKTWTKKKFCTVILTEFLEYAKSRDTSYRITLSFCAEEIHNFEEAIADCKTVKQSVEAGGQPSGHGTKINKDSKSNSISVAVKKGSLDKTEADVLACAISADLDLRRGAVSNALLEKGGSALQKDLDKRYPTAELPFGEIFSISGHGLHCRHVFFGVMFPFELKSAKQYTSSEEYYRVSVHDFVQACLNTAEEGRYNSIAFPAVGAGSLGYPVDIVADEMFQTVLNWGNSSDALHLKEISFVVYHADTSALLAFQEAEKRYGASRRQSLMKTSEVYMSKPNALSRQGEEGFIFLIPKGYTAELIQLYCKETIDHLKRSDCEVEFTGDVGTVRGPSDVKEIAGVKMRDAVNNVEKAFPARDLLDLTQSDFNQNEVRGKLEEIKNSLNVLCFLDKVKQKLSFFGKSFQEVKEAKDRVVRLLLPPRNKSVSDNSKGVQQNNKFKSRSHRHIQSRNNGKVRYAEEVFETKERVTVRVYSADILTLPVDGIVNAANVKLAHGGGIARAIAKAAGKDLAKEGQDILKKHGQLKVGQACSTSAGQMKYKRVVHAVGPCWTDYKPYTLKDVERCEIDLYNAIVNSLAEAEKQNLQTVAVSSISSGKYGCPLDLCSVQYARAVLDYSRLAKCRLKEIHFVDTNKQMVQIIQETFEAMIPGEKVPKFYNKLKYAKSIGTGASQGAAGSTSRKSSSGTYDHQNDVRTDRGRSSLTSTGNNSAGLVVYPYCHRDFPPGQNKKAFACCFGAGQNLYIYQADILLLTGIDIIVCGNTSDGKTKGYLANAIENKGGAAYKTGKEKAFKSYAASRNIIVCPSGKVDNYKKVAHVILLKKTDYKNEDDRKFKLTETFHRIFMTLKEERCLSMVLPLIGTGFGKGDPVYFANRFIDGLLDFCLYNKGYNFQIHLVHDKLQKTQTVVDTVAKAVRDARPLPKTNHSKRQHFSSSQKTPARSAGSLSARERHGREAFYHNGDINRSSEEGRRNNQGKGKIRNRHKHGEYSERKELTCRDFLHKDTAFSTDESETENNNKKKVVKETAVTDQREKFKLGCDSSTDSDEDKEKETNTVLNDTTETSKPSGNLTIFDETASAQQLVSDEGEIEVSEDEEDSDASSVEVPDQVSANDDTDEKEVEICVICMEEITDPSELPCGHIFCTDCIEAQFTYKEACPTCGKVCGIITGDQPEGKMLITTNNEASCAGYEDCGRIEITYRFPEGRQGPNHSSPGTRYKGITRNAYLPNNRRGKQICAMLNVAFDRKLVFTIGRSRTTGSDGVITWNDIHHKTDPKPNTQFGYPDPTYLDRVTEELEIKGVTVNDIPTVSAPKNKRRR